MDIPRESVARRRNIRRAMLGVVGLAAIVATTLGLSKLEPALPSVDRAIVVTDTVKRGSMLREVRGTGTLVPEVVWWIPAQNAGRVEQILVLPGRAVSADTVLLELSNPQLQLDMVDAQWKLKSAEADAVALEVQLRNDFLSLQESVARVSADLHEAQLRLAVNQELYDDGLISQNNLELSKANVEELKKLDKIQQQRLEINDSSQDAQRAAQTARVEQARALFALKSDQVDLLHVRAGTDGVLEQLPVQVGAQVRPGDTLAKVTDPKSLKAVIRIPETRAQDVRTGQTALIDTRNGIVSGRVVRIDPAVLNATVAVDVSFDGGTPAGARPDQNVVGTIEIERLDNILYVGRPIYGQAESTIGLFKVSRDGATASRARVELGRSSVSTIEIISGLLEGDEVILTDMSQQDAFDKIRLR